MIEHYNALDKCLKKQRDQLLKQGAMFDSLDKLLQSGRYEEARWLSGKIKLCIAGKPYAK
jgi:hypothetical protein